MAGMQRGQEEAPIELLIAVTVLTFVLIVGFYTYQSMCASQFEQKMQASLTKFANDLETVYLGAKGTTIPSQLDFSPIGCAGDVDSVRLFKGTDDLCLQHTASQDCLVLALVARAEGAKADIIIIEPLNIRTANTNILHENPNRAVSDPACMAVGGVGLTGIETIFAEDGFSGFSPQDCFMWAMQDYTLILEKTEVNQITIKG